MKNKILLISLILYSIGPAVTAVEFITIDRFVAHVSSVPANKGEKVGLFLHEKLAGDTQEKINSGEPPRGRVVLFVHGNSVPSVPDFDLPYRDYSWMEYLAGAGFDTFAMDHTGYGYSPRPKMDNPCNMSTENQQAIIPHALQEVCEPDYPYSLNNSDSDWDEIDSVVDYIRELRGVDRVSLIAWSWGGIRAGGYTALHPEKVDRLILYAPGYSRDWPASAGDRPVPPRGLPMTLQTREALMVRRWRDEVECDDQIDPEIQPVIWQNIMGFDSYGAAWHPDGVMRVRMGNYWGWNREYAAKVDVPTLILIGEQDFLLENADNLYLDLTGTDNKVLALMECATHFAVWEKTQYKFMQEASKEWLTRGTVRGHKNGKHRISADRK